ncbi:hypothetical protein [Aeromonas phage AerS_266]|nr:hypothetical protein [Aeromonas phage AerS_266]
MHNKPTPWQFLLDLFAKKRIADVVKTGNEAQIAEIKKLYENLKESEVVFSNPEFVKKIVAEKSYWKVSFECTGRGFASPAITFRTYPLSVMIGKNAKVLTGHPTLVKTPGFYINKETGNLHLIVIKDSDLEKDPILETGYYFEREYLTFEELLETEADKLADGIITINYPQVAGQIYVNYIKPEPVKLVVEEPVTEEKKVTEETLQETQKEDVTDETEITDQGDSENQDQQDTVAEKTTEVTQKFQHKNKRR